MQASRKGGGDGDGVRRMEWRVRSGGDSATQLKRRGGRRDVMKRLKRRRCSRAEKPVGTAAGVGTHTHTQYTTHTDTHTHTHMMYVTNRQQKHVRNKHTHTYIYTTDTPIPPIPNPTTGCAFGQDQGPPPLFWGWETQKNMFVPMYVPRIYPKNTLKIAYFFCPSHTFIGAITQCRPFKCSLKDALLRFPKHNSGGSLNLPQSAPGPGRGGGEVMGV